MRIRINKVVLYMLAAMLIVAALPCNCIAQLNVTYTAQIISVNCIRDANWRRDQNVIVTDSLGKKGLISHNLRKVVLPCRYDAITLRANGDALLDSMGYHGLAAHSGAIKIPCVYDSLYTSWYSRGIEFPIYTVCKNNKWGRLNDSGRITTPIKFDEVKLFDFPEFYYTCLVRIGQFWGVSNDATGNIIPPIYHHINFTLYQNPVRYIVTDTTGLMGILDERGNILFPCLYEDIYPGEEQRAHMLRDSVWYRIDADGAEHKLGRFQSLSYWGNDLYRVGQNDKYGIVDVNGKMLLPAIYTEIFSQYKTGGSYCEVSIDRKHGLFSDNFQEILPTEYEEIKRDDNNIFAWSSSGISVFDSIGRLLFSGDWKEMATIGDGYYKVRKGWDRWGIVDSTGQMILPCMYKEIKERRNGRFWITDTLRNNLIADNSGIHKVLPWFTGWYEYLRNRTKVSSNYEPALYSDTNGHLFRRYPVAHRYKDVGSFYEGRAKVTDSEGYFGFIDTSGREVVHCVFSDVANYKNGLAAVGYDFGVTNNQDNVYSSAPCDTTLPGTDVEEFPARKRRYGYIDREGKPVIPFLYQTAISFGSFAEDRTIVRQGDSWKIINKTGKVIVKDLGDKIPFSNYGCAGVVNGGKGRIIDTNGKRTGRMRKGYRYYNFDATGMAMVGKKDKAGFLNKRGRKMIGMKYDYLSVFSAAGIAAYMKKSGEYDDYSYIGLMDRRGKCIVNEVYTSIELSAIGSQMVVANDTGYGIINSLGQMLVPCRYDYIGHPGIDNGYFLARAEEKRGYIRSNGDTAIPFIYDQAGIFNEGLAPVRIGDRWLFIDQEGKEVLTLGE